MPIPADAVSARLLREGWTLHERLRLAASRRASGDPSESCLSEGQLETWQRVVAPDNPSNFEKRLRWDGLTLVDAAWALQPDDAAVPAIPPWWELLLQLRQAAVQAAGSAAVPGPLAERGRHYPFVHVWRPAASWALQQLQRRCEPLQPQLLLAEAAWLDLGEALLERLSNIADQALWELFNQRRSPGQMLLAHLGADGDGSGAPVCEVYNGFVQELLAGGYGLVLGEYPVLGRLLAVATALWLEASEEMLQRVADSRSELEQGFSIPPNAVLRRIQLGLSDPHRGGRAVAILHFGVSTGADLIRVVYKPKDMRVDVTYQAVLQTLNKASSLPPLRCLTIISRSDYGFMEWVEHRLCTGEQELERFYRNAGRSLALLYLLGCTDCHFENLIASGDQLVLIDTETLLEADLSDHIIEAAGQAEGSSPLQISMQGSVLRSGLLPKWVIAGAGRKLAFDISALGIQPPPKTREMPGWLGLNSDGMMAGRITQTCELPTSLPVGLGSPQRLSDFVEQLCEGFAVQMQEALLLRPLLLDALESFKGKPRRLVPRATRLYFIIQRQMLEPAALRSAMAHGFKLEQLSRSFVLARETPHNWPMFAAEIRQMERLDIPYFEHRIDGEDLPLPDGQASIPQFMKCSGLAAARRRLETLDADVIAFEQQLIRGAIAARHLSSPAQHPPADAPCPTPPSPDASPALLGIDVYRAEAFRLGEMIWAAAIRDRQGRPEWLGMDLAADGESFHFGLIGPSLYSGSSGIAVLFARLARSCQDLGDAEAAALWRHRAWSCLAALEELAARNRDNQLFRLVRDLPYGTSGSGGLLLVLQLLQQAGEPAAGTLAQQLMAQLRPERLRGDEGIDVLTGISGLIGPLLRMGSSDALALAEVCGERLLSTQLEAGGWSPGTDRKPALTGFSHGAAGMAAALARLAQVSGQDRFTEAARRAVTYERSVFVAKRGNWPDFRASREPKAFMLSWCHGAPGILLSRLVLRASGVDDPYTEQELLVARGSTCAALENLMRRGASQAAHLCCGVMGLTSLLRIEGQVRGVPLAPVVQQAESALMAEAIDQGHYSVYSVDSGSLNLPGFFTGHAGVALALLEAAEGPCWLPPLLSAGLLPPA